ncbi:MAG: S66 peptidase family protein [Clostridiaceae bacterium]|nr:S66 peptidase family protein [Clostridiaceae bacterium]
MNPLVKPPKLSRGDTVATVSLSWGGAGDRDLLWRYQVGKQRLERQFGLKVIEMEHTLSGSDYLYHHPEKRAQNLMQAFSDTDVKAVFSCIGGEESIRLLPYVDLTVIRNNPKIFIGYSDSTITHLMCLKAGISSFYGPSILGELAENYQIYDYTIGWLKKTLFETKPLGPIPCADEWTGERVEWMLSNAGVRKRMCPNRGYELLQGSGTVRGRLIGGCIEVLEMAKGTILWPDCEAFDDAVLFFETSEDMPDPVYLEYWLRNYGSQGILQRVKAILFGKPYQETHYDAYKASVQKIFRELNLSDTPILYNLSFGHNQPMCILPYGALAEVNCEKKSVSILESGAV